MGPLNSNKAWKCLLLIHPELSHPQTPRADLGLGFPEICTCLLFFDSVNSLLAFHKLPFLPNLQQKNCQYRQCLHFRSLDLSSPSTMKWLLTVLPSWDTADGKQIWNQAPRVCSCSILSQSEMLDKSCPLG